MRSCILKDSFQKDKFVKVTYTLVALLIFSSCGTASEFSLKKDQLENAAIDIYFDNDPNKLPLLWKKPKFVSKNELLIMEKSIEFKNGHADFFQDFRKLCNKNSAMYRQLHDSRLGDTDAVCESTDGKIVHFYLYLNPARCYGKDCKYAEPMLVLPETGKESAFMKFLVESGYKTKEVMETEIKEETARNMREGQAFLHAELNYEAVRTRGTKVCKKDQANSVTAYVDDVAEENIRLLLSDGKVIWDSPSNWTRCL